MYALFLPQRSKNIVKCFEFVCVGLNSIFTARSELRKAVNCVRFCFWRCYFFVSCVRNISGAAERICAKFTQKTGLVPRSESLNVKVKGQKR